MIEMSFESNIPNIIPPLISHSPPPVNSCSGGTDSTNNSDDLDDSISLPNLATSITSSSSSSLTNSNNPNFNIDPNISDQNYLNPPLPPPPNNTNNNDWDPFKNSNNLKHLTGNQNFLESNLDNNSDSNWASFSGGFQDLSNDNNGASLEIVSKEQQPPDDNKQEEETNHQVNNNDDDDEEWADFVETPVLIESKLEENIQSPLPPTTTTTLDNCSSLPNKPALKSIPSQPIEPTNFLLINNLIEKLFTNYHHENMFNSCESNNNNCTNNDINDTTVNELNIDLDDNWQELKTYTSINDASISLKFKWYLSNLEDNYLKSLNLQRATLNNNTTTQNQKRNFPNFVSNDILQPIKVEPTQIMNKSNDISSNNHINNSNHHSNLHFIEEIFDVNNFNESDQNNKLNNEITNNNTATLSFNPDDLDKLAISKNPDSNSSKSTVLDIDLSYFESNINGVDLDSNQISSNSSKTSSNSKPNSNKKGYLDMLLRDIYANHSNNNTNGFNKQTKAISSINASSNSISSSKKDDDVLSDKKSISSTSSNSSSNLNELSIQLQPHKLEQQQYLDQLQTSQTNDRKAIEFLSNLKTVNKPKHYSKGAAMIYPIKQIVQTSNLTENKY